VTDALFLAPRIAWPTLAVFASSLALWLSAPALVLTGRLGLPVGVALSTLAAYAIFTPLHDAIHRTVGRSRALNEIVGRASALVLLGPLPAVRRFHLEHHKHTNDPALDPDHWSGRGPAWLLPLRWATQDLHYYFRFARAYRRHRRAERVEVVATFALLVLAALYLTWHGQGALCLWFWIVPARLATLILAFAFDYLPHRPHLITAAEDRYQATHVVDQRALGWILFGQSYHLVHHLYPGVPFYRYRAIWKRELRAPMS
jgi:fatty acid desaturase